MLNKIKKNKLLMLTLIFLFVLLATSSVYGFSEKTPIPKLYFFNDNVIDEEVNSESIFIFSKGKVNVIKDASIFLFFSTISFEKNINERVLSFFSEITILKNCYVKEIRTLSSKITSKTNEFTNENINPYIENINFIVTEGKDKNNNYFYSDEIPYFLIVIILIIIKLFVAFIFLALKNSFFIQGYGAIINDTSSIFQNGLIAYAIFITLFLVFIISVVGFPVSILFLIVYYILVLVGQVSIGLFVGSTITSQLLLNPNIFRDMLLGVLLIESISLFPYVMAITKLFVIPYISVGVTVTTLINGYVGKVFYETPFNMGKESEKLNQNELRNIITGKKTNYQKSSKKRR